MSQIFGKVTNAVLSGTNENSFSLANLNLGFSLVKLEAPAEFHPLGSALSIQRRETAETGSHHQTARMLGALFSQVAPNAPKLLRAFGQRVSEIIKSPGANPTGTFEDGPFKDSVGADATSIWAAATSGSASLAVLLLACLLARKFDDPKLSVAIWVEMVAIRQKEVLETAQSTGFAMNEAVIAAQQRILREDLATFDASVRAWLITADQVMAKKIKQLRLILDNLTTLPVSVGKDTYAKIINAWKGAIEGFEALLEGKPQNATDSSVLLALSAWHLYPDLIVLASETKKVVFQDSLFSHSVAITVGLSLRDNDQVSPGFKWSLALSHLRYYGEPVSVQTDHDNYRITMDELCLIAFGSLLAHWRLPNRIMIDVASWFCSLYGILQRYYGDDLSPGGDWSGHPGFLWLQPLINASKLLVNRSEDDSANFEKLVGYGRRRGRDILGHSRVPGNSPFFGICNPYVAKGLATPVATEEYLHQSRSLVESSKIATFAVFQYWETIAGTEVLVLATATPYTWLPHWCSAAEGQQQQKLHARWVVTDSSDHLAAFKQRLNLYRASSSEIIGSISRNRRHSISGELALQLHVPPSSFYLLGPTPAPLHALFEEQSFWIDRGSFGYELDGIQKRHATTAGDNHSEQCLNLDPWISSYKNNPEINLPGSSLFCPVWALTSKPGISLFAVYESASVYENQLESLSSLQISNLEARNVEETLQHVRLENFCEEKVARYFKDVTVRRGHNDHNFEDSRGDVEFLSRSYFSSSTFESLHYLGLMSQLYAQFPSATFPIKIVEKQFNLAEVWEESASCGCVHLEDLSMQEALQAICVMEAGGVAHSHFRLNRAFAIAAGNSIFVAESLLSEPSRHPPGYAIRRIVGNLGLPGVSILVSPESARVKEKTRDFRAIEHAPYNYRREDNFGATSLHLSLTEWKVPLAFPSDGIGNIDQDIFLVEAVVSVYDRGRWYGDIDILGGLKRLKICPISAHCECRRKQARSQLEIISIDNFDEILDPPDGVGIFRAHENWSARLAGVCIAKQMLGAERVWIAGNDEICWNCLESDFERSRNLREGVRGGDSESEEGEWDAEEDDGDVGVDIIID
ncbi:hypothetical protein CLAIMM_06370 [Cladophialophora immunda]|nr:hypothetical protein CLAIMM_06370 [Cladophialophora immunda]